MQIILNGEPHDLPDMQPDTLPAQAYVADLIEQLGLVGQRLAIEVNGDIVPRSQHTERQLCAGDRVEVVRAIGGG